VVIEVIVEDHMTDPASD